MKRSLQQTVLRHERANHRIVSWHDVESPDEDEPVVGIDIAFVVLGQPDVVFDFLVRSDSAHEQKVHQPVIQNRFERGPADRLRDAIGIHGNGEHAGRLESQRFEFLSVVLRVAEGQIHPAHQRDQLVPAERGEAEEVRIVRRKERRGRHVVILQDASAVERRERLGHGRRQRIVKDRQIATPRLRDRRTGARRRSDRRRSTARTARTSGPSA